MEGNIIFREGGNLPAPFSVHVFRHPGVRAAKEILEGIKQECGSDFPVSMRLGLKTFVKGFEQASLTGEQLRNMDADTVVIAVGFRPAPSMAQELQGCGAVVYEIGDGQKVSTILHAVWDGYEVGNNI